mmetsp:Transcript_4496/g.6747  ORF Transcript_4496/g.6747 Transcript_4496/m.6747 type:complete len:239 (+) Transcript_4496:501-1217(+)
MTSTDSSSAGDDNSITDTPVGESGEEEDSSSPEDVGGDAASGEAAVVVETEPLPEEEELPLFERIKLKIRERWDLSITILATFIILLLLKIQHNASIRHLKRQLGDAEYKIQQAIFHIEKEQAEKVAKGEIALKEREKRRQSLALPNNPDISHADLSDIGESKVEYSLVEKHEVSFQDGLKKLSDKLMGKKPALKKSLTIKPSVPTDLVDAESLEGRVKEKEIMARGNYELKSDLTDK